MKKATWALLVFLSIGVPAFAETPEVVEEKPKPWYERFSFRGYAQLRYNRLGETNPALNSDQGDKSIGDKNGLFLRRARLIFSGDASPNVYVYVQPDFASSPATGVLHFLQIRDLYADVSVDALKEFRFRLGQSKVPFGFENLQSSQNRLPLDRADSVNSAVKDERDLGAYFYWAPAPIRKRFKHLVDSGLKGSGDYGVFGIGAYNGQTANRSEANNNLHYVARVTYPYEFSNGQIVEASIQGYTGTFTVTRGTGIGGGDEFTDQRLAASLIIYPQPIGLEAEYVVGEGPELNETQTTVEKKSLQGAHVLLSYKFNNFIPYARWHYYIGGRKHETNSPRQKVYETELGIEWQPLPAFELTAAYAIADRTSVRSPYNNENGRLIRLQAQWNF